MDVAEWLRGLGLEQYVPAFHQNDIDGEVLRRLAGDDLRDLGVTSVGHRRRLLDAIAALREAQPATEASVAPVTAAMVIGAAERRQLTVMFTDLVDSTVLASCLDPEELGEVIGAYHRCVAEVVGRFDGFLAKYLGDGVLAYFGFPVAHEDDAERAIRAGLEVTRAVAALIGRGVPMSARVGIATGLVVVGEIAGSEANAVVGETPNLAARLQAEAPPGGIVIAPATRRLAGDWFSYRDLGARPLKGIGEPMRLTQVLDEVLVLLEDAHWIDPTTRELIDAVIQPIGQLRVMLLVTCRPEFQNLWGGHSHVTSLTLNRLGQRQCADLIGEVVGGRPLPDAITRAIIERADGVPLFVEELTKSVLESGLLREADGGLVVDRPLPPLAIPTTLQGSLLARLDRLSATREVAQVGAAIGREFDYQLLAAVAGLPDERLRHALSELETAGLVFRRGSPPEAAYIFKHALVQGTAHDSLLKSRRQQLHARIAEAIERHYPETASAQPQLLAQHYAEAGFAERSARAWLAAGHLSASRSASAEAALQFVRGIDVLQGMEPGPERDRLELDLQIGRGSACAAAYGHGAVDTENSWARAIALLRSHPEDPRNFWVRRGLSSVYGARADMAAYGALARETAERAQQSGDPAGLCVAQMMLANFYGYTGKFAPYERATLEAARHVHADSHHESFRLSGLDITVHVPLGRAMALSFLGD